jgi:hypothetical protein
MNATRWTCDTLDWSHVNFVSNQDHLRALQARAVCLSVICTQALHWTVNGADVIIALRCREAGSTWEAICANRGTQTRTTRPASSSGYARCGDPDRSHGPERPRASRIRCDRRRPVPTVPGSLAPVASASVFVRELVTAAPVAVTGLASLTVVGPEPAHQRQGLVAPCTSPTQVPSTNSVKKAGREPAEPQHPPSRSTHRA